MRLCDLTRPRPRRTSLWEGKVVHNDGHLIVIENPTRTEVMNLIQQSIDKELRGLLVGPKLLVWDAYSATHDEATQVLGIQDSAAYQIELRPDGVLYDFVLKDVLGYEPDDEEEGIDDISAVADEHRDEIARHPMLVRVYGPGVDVQVSWY